MMFDGPRVFVGTTTFLVAGMTSRIDLQTVTAAIECLPGVAVVNAQQSAGLVTVTADRPVNRTDLAAAIIRVGYTVLA